MPNSKMTSKIASKKFYRKIDDHHYRESFGLEYDEFEIGAKIDHRPGRTITQSDNIWQSSLHLNISPLHIDTAYMEKTEWGKPLVSSLVLFSIVNAQTVSSISAKAVANLGWDNVKMTNPCFVGDTIYTTTEILSKRLSKSKPNHGVIKCKTLGYNQNDVPLMTCERSILFLVDSSGFPIDNYF